MRPMPAPQNSLPDDADDALQVVNGDLEETVDGIPVLAEVQAIESVSPASLPAVQAAAAAATGFVAGAATLVLLRRRGARKLARTALRHRRGLDALPILGTRSFLVDVHLISKPEE
jgi:hypothetical protein